MNLGLANNFSYPDNWFVSINFKFTNSSIMLSRLHLLTRSFSKEFFFISHYLDRGVLHEISTEAKVPYL